MVEEPHRRESLGSKSATPTVARLSLCERSYASILIIMLAFSFSCSHSHSHARILFLMLAFSFSCSHSRSYARILILMLAFSFSCEHSRSHASILILMRAFSFSCEHSHPHASIPLSCEHSTLMRAFHSHASILIIAFSILILVREFSCEQPGQCCDRGTVYPNTSISD